MKRSLEAVIFGYAVLSAACWGDAARWVYGKSDGLWCGNVVSDPYRLLVEYVAPWAAVCVGVLGARAVKRRRWEGIEVAAMLAFVVTSAGLVWEAGVLEGRLGIELGPYWWQVWR